MDLERAWWWVTTLTAPTPPGVARAMRAWNDLKAGAGLVNDLRPDPPAHGDRSDHPDPQPS